MSVVFDAEAAKKGIIEHQKKVEKIEGLVSEGNLDDAVTLYRTLPVSFQINWKIAGIDAAEIQKKCDAALEVLAPHVESKGEEGGEKLQRAFNGNE